ncbi:MAG: glycosyltransferase family 2 protein [Rhodocyclales bacterium]|nr:glycosyltransferase family 2 protein [Rhodocyclales bacterium]
MTPDTEVLPHEPLVRSEPVECHVDVSVVIPTYGRPDLLRRCLEALCHQDLPHHRYEIVVADDGPSAETEQTVLAYASRSEATSMTPQIRYIPVVATQGPAGARNRGWQAAWGRIIAFTDDDTVPARNWLSAGLAAMTGGADAATGQVKVPVPEHPTDYERDVGGLATAEFVTANCFVTRAALVATQGFDERYTRAWREDSDLQFSLMQHGLTIADAPDAVVLHPIRPAPWGVSMRMQSKVYFDALLYSKYPGLYRQRIRPTPPWNYYVSLLAIVIAVGAALAGQPALCVFAALVWLALTAAFCIRRLRGAARTLSHIAEMALTSIAIPPLALYWRIRGSLHFKVLFL